jgi:hypothetical protein
MVQWEARKVGPCDGDSKHEDRFVVSANSLRFVERELTANALVRTVVQDGPGAQYEIV